MDCGSFFILQVDLGLCLFVIVCVRVCVRVCTAYLCGDILGYLSILAKIGVIEGSLDVKLPTIWRDEKQSREEAERRERLEERRVEEKE